MDGLRENNKSLLRVTMNDLFPEPLLNGPEITKVPATMEANRVAGIELLPGPMRDIFFTILAQEGFIISFKKCLLAPPNQQIADIAMNGIIEQDDRSLQELRLVIQTRGESLHSGDQIVLHGGIFLHCFSPPFTKTHPERPLS